VVLLRTHRHAAARARLVIVPPAPASLKISGSSHRVQYGSTTSISGIVTSASGAPVAGHRVVLLRRGPAGWRRVAHAVTDVNGQVFLSTPEILGTTGFRLRTDHHVHSVGWRVVEVPSLTASGRRDGAVVDVSATARGGRAGDKVVLVRKAGSRLVRVAHGSLAADGTVGFQVPARRARTTYVVRLLATHHHAPATAKATVPRAG
jgi:5-hydroxyisourate hydrolase-like protein (transthyretin family)